MNITHLTITKAKEGLRKKEFSAAELTKAYLARIKRLESKINAFVTVTEEEALKNAKDADKKIAAGVDLPLLGIPLSIKANFSTSGIRTTASTKALDSY